MRSFFGLATALVVLLAACAQDSETQTDTSGAPQPDTQVEDGDLSELDALEDVDVDRGLLTVSITIPASLAEDGDIDTLITDFSDRGVSVSSATRNSDGSITYRLPRGDYRRLMAELADEMQTSLDEAAAEFASVESIAANNDFTQFRMVVDRPRYEESLDGFVVFATLFAAGLYGIFDGRDPKTGQIVIDLIDVATGETYDTFVAPDDFDN